MVVFNSYASEQKLECAQEELEVVQGEVADTKKKSARIIDTMTVSELR